MAEYNWQAKDFLLASDTELWLYPVLLGLTDGAPADATVTVGTGGAAANATSVPVTALNRKLFKDTRLSFGTEDVILTADALSGATSLAVKPLEDAILAGATATTKGLVPLYSINKGDTKINGETIKARNFGSGPWNSMRKTVNSFSISCSGFFIRNDPGFKVLRDASLKLDRCYFELVEPDGYKEMGIANVTDLSRSRSVDQNVEISWSFEGDGALTCFDPV